MSKITVLNEKAIAAHVMHKPKQVFVDKGQLCVLYNYGGHVNEMEFAPETEEIDLPEGKWIIERMADEMTEEQWKGIVKPESTFGYPSYGQIPGGSFQWYAKPSSSGMALIKSKNLNPESILILIKQ